MKKMLLLLLSLFACSTGFSQQLHLKHLRTTVDSIALNLVEQEGPGMSIGIIHHGKPILNKHYGMMNLDYRMKTSDSTAYNLASVSKHITAFGILLLEAEGKLQLQDKLGDHLPDLPDAYRNISIDQLLHHTSGIPSTDNLLLFSGTSLDAPWTMADELKLLKKYSQLNFEPGSEYMYSNGGYSLLAAVIESAAGTDFSDFFRQRLFEPLQLHADVKDSHGKIIQNRARGYKPVSTGFEDVLSESVPGASNFYFSMNDMLTWMKLLLQKNSGFSPITEKMMQPSFVLSTGDTVAYSYGLFVKDFKGVKRVYHSGGTAGFASYMLLFPEHDLGISVLSNNEQLNVSKIVYALAEGILQEYLEEEREVKRVAIDIAEEKLKTWEDSYRMKDGMILKIVFDDGSLFLVLPDDQRFEIHPESENHFFIAEFDAQIAFSRPLDDDPLKLELVQGSSVQVGVVIDPKELAQAPPTPHVLKGGYYQPQLEVTFVLEEENGDLVLQLPVTFEKYLNFKSVRLTPLAGDVFNTDRLGVVEFLRNNEKEISGMRLKDVGRLRNIDFTKIQ